MKKYRVLVTLKPGLLDPAGRAVGESLRSLGFTQLQDVRIGKVIELSLSDGSVGEVEEMARKVLVNPVIEEFQIEEVS
ncbi:MAG TPA: phosphoribosylformylglycinamidine synthase subunit PurS [Fimbriimonadales bacterium]|nr:phosphoribosylformylglycinamidine synthase subunit PurS [Fimbriimonadales bacterium]